MIADRSHARLYSHAVPQALPLQLATFPLYSYIYIYIYISHTLFNFNDDVSLRFNRRIFHRYLSGVFHFFLFFFFFFYILSSLPSLSACSVRFRDASIELCAAKTNWKYLGPRNIGNGFDSTKYIYIYSRGDNGISGRAGSLLNIRPLGVLYTSKEPVTKWLVVLLLLRFCR